MKRATFGELYRQKRDITDSSAALLSAFIQRLNCGCMGFGEIEAKIARWEALEEDAARDQVRFGGLAITKAALHAAEVAGNRCGKGAAVQALQPAPKGWMCSACFAPATASFDGSSWCPACLSVYQEEHPPRQDDPTRVDHSPKVAVECGCGGPAGHVPNGVWCRRGMR